MKKLLLALSAATASLSPIAAFACIDLTGNWYLQGDDPGFWYLSQNGCESIRSYEDDSRTGNFREYSFGLRNCHSTRAHSYVFHQCETWSIEGDTIVRVTSDYSDDRYRRPTASYRHVFRRSGNQLTVTTTGQIGRDRTTVVETYRR